MAKGDVGAPMPGSCAGGAGGGAVCAETGWLSSSRIAADAAPRANRWRTDRMMPRSFNLSPTYRGSPRSHSPAPNKTLENRPDSANPSRQVHVTYLHRIPGVQRTVAHLARGMQRHAPLIHRIH